VASLDVQGERASVVTVRGTRYPFRKCPNGIWGLTIFTANLLAEAECIERFVGAAVRSRFERAAGETRLNEARSGER
jgi:hypothetical protein